MKMNQKFLAMAMAAAVLVPLSLVSGPAQSQTPAQAGSQTTPRIEGFNVDEVRRLVPGTELGFEIFGTPGGQATLRIDGAQRNLSLTETEAGQYEGVYTITSRDRIVARSPVTANLRIGNQVESLVLNESLQIGVGYHGPKMAPGPMPKINHFNVDPAAELKGGNELYFSVFGTPGGQVDLAIQGVKGKVLLPEVASGEYTSTYTIRNRDRIVRSSVVTATMRLGARVSTATLGKALQSADAPAPLDVSRMCQTCGTVESVNLIQVQGEGGYLGTIGGGVVGAILGNQVGQGNGRTAAQIAGALGGAYAGRALEGKSRASNHYEVVVRMHNGTAQTISFAAEPGFKVGDKVKISAGVIAHNL